MKLPKYLVLKSRVFWMSKSVPVGLRGRVGKTHIQVRLGSDAAAAMDALPKAVLYADNVIQQARDEDSAPDIVDLALQFRAHFIEVTDDPERHPDEWAAPLGDEVERVAEKYGDSVAKTYYKIATNRETPILAYLDAWNATSAANPASIARRTSALRKLEVWLEERHILVMDRVTRRVSSERVQFLLAEGLMPPTINILLASYSSLWKFCIRNGSLSKNPWDGHRVKDSKNRVKRLALTEPELDKLLRFASKDRLALDVVRTLALSGLRVAEAANLTVENMLTPPQFDITSAKTRAGVRAVPIHQDLRAMISRRCQGKEPGDRLFHELHHTNVGAQLTGLGTKWFRAAGLTQNSGARQSLVSLHSLRHRAANLMEKAGVPEGTMAFVLGHERKSMTLGTYSRSGPGIEALTKAINTISI